MSSNRRAEPFGAARDADGSGVSRDLVGGPTYPSAVHQLHASRAPDLRDLTSPGAGRNACRRWNAAHGRRTRCLGRHWPRPRAPHASHPTLRTCLSTGATGTGTAPTTARVSASTRSRSIASSRSTAISEQEPSPEFTLLDEPLTFWHSRAIGDPEDPRYDPDALCPCSRYGRTAKGGLLRRRRPPHRGGGGRLGEPRRGAHRTRGRHGMGRQ